jgi:hypothetical protein
MPPTPDGLNPPAFFDARFDVDETSGVNRLVLDGITPFTAPVNLIVPEGVSSVNLEWSNEGIEANQYMLVVDGQRIDMASETSIEVLPAQSISFEFIGDPTAVENMVQEYALDNNFPNPFNPETTISYAIKAPGRVELTIYNALGQQVRHLVNEHQEIGRYSINWDGRNDQGNLVSGGVYLYRIKANDFVKSRKMLFLK